MAEDSCNFMPGSWGSMGVDGDGDGRADIYNDADSIHSAAHYLAKSGFVPAPRRPPSPLRLQPRLGAAGSVEVSEARVGSAHDRTDVAVGPRSCGDGAADSGIVLVREDPRAAPGFSSVPAIRRDC